MRFANLASVSLVSVSAFALFAASAPVQAQLVEQTSRAGIGAVDSVDWGNAGANGTAVNSPFTITSTLGNVLSVSEAAGPFYILQQNNNWGGNFAPGDNLLYTGSAFGSGGGPIAIDFGTAVSGAGLQIAEDFYGNYTAEVTAYDASHNLLGSFTENGVANGDSDNSAIFLGVTDATTNIGELVYSLSATQNGTTTDFAVNQMSIGPSGAASTPEPGAYALIAGMGLTGAGFLRRRGRGARK